MVKKSVLVVAAHPDDESLGCGGTIARLAQKGHDVYVAVLGEGITSRYEHPEDADVSQVASLHECSRRVAEILGARDIFLHALPDNRFDSVPLLDVIKIVEKLVERLCPDVIYTHHGGDLNIDHQITHRAVLTAARPLETCTVKDIYSFEVPSSTEWAFHQFEPAFHPNVVEDITGTMEVKLQAVQLYESEVRSFPNPRSAQALRAIAHRWGSVSGCEAAEAFELIRSVRFD